MSEVPNFTPEEIVSKIQEDYQKKGDRTESIAAVVDAEYTFQVLAAQSISTIQKGFCEAEHGTIPSLIELGAFHLFPHFGEPGTRDPKTIQEFFDALRSQNVMRGLATGLKAPPPLLTILCGFICLFTLKRSEEAHTPTKPV